jgi:uncharacterized membrane protein
MSKSKPPKIDLTGYRYYSILPAIELTPVALINPLKRSHTKWSRKIAPSLTELSALVGINLENEQYAKAISTHQNRMMFYFAINGLLASVVYLAIGAVLLFFVVFTFIIMSRGDIPPSLSRNTSWITTILFFFVFGTILQLAGRISSTILDRYYADSLAYLACLNLIVHLNKENSLMLTRERQHLLIRVRGLRRYIILLSYQYPTRELGSKNWAHSQFKQMETFIREKESQIIAPQADTQSKISTELYDFLKILLTAQYGDFKYQSVPESEETVQTQENQTRSWVIRFLGLISPIILIIVNYYFKEQLQAIGLDNQIVALVGLAWLLLALDANLNLGIVDRIASLAKAMRELR